MEVETFSFRYKFCSHGWFVVKNMILVKVLSFKVVGEYYMPIANKYVFSTHPPLQLLSKVPHPWALDTYVLYGIELSKQVPWVHMKMRMTYYLYKAV